MVNSHPPTRFPISFLLYMTVTGKSAMEPAEVNRSNDVPKVFHFSLAEFQQEIKQFFVIVICLFENLIGLKGRSS